MPLSEHLNVAITFKMTEWVEQHVYIKFCIKFVHSPAETIRMIQKGRSSGQLVIGSVTMTMHLLMHHVSYRVFWQNIKSPRWLSSPTSWIWHPMTSGFSPNYNHVWKGRDFRLSMRFRKIWWGSWWQLGELCEVSRCLLRRGLRCLCPTYNVSCILYILQ